MACAHDRNIDRAQRGLDASFGVNGFTDHWEPHFFKVGHIAHAAVNDEADRTACLKAGGQQVAKKSVVVVCGASCHGHVAGLQLLGSDMHHPVVARLQKDRYRRAAHVGAFVDGAHVGFHQTHAAHGLMNGGDTEF